jgi:hypothetical protein
MKKYSGAGVIPIILYKKKPYLILFMLNNGTITDAGGKIENNISVINTSVRELYEESAGLFNLQSEILNNNSVYFDIKYYDTYYRIYFIIFNNFDISNMNYYYYNLEKIKKNKFNPFSETRNIHLISLDYIHFIDNNKIILMNNHINQVFVLSNRTGEIIKKIYKKFTNLNDFYDSISKKINKINLQKKITNPISYTYEDHKKIKIHELITFFLRNQL